MFIDLDLLYANGAITREYVKNEIVFKEGELANFYYQIVEGVIKMCNLNEEGKEFIQGIFYDGQSFGEPPLFLDEKYPASAVVCSNSTIIKLSKEKFLKLIDEHPFIQRNFLILMSKRNLNKAIISREIINHTPQHRILSFLEMKKTNAQIGKELVPYTRQEIANFTGLRVETVIRELSKLNKEKIVEIKDHKLYF